MNVYKLIYWLIIQSRLYQNWSRLYKFLFQRKYKNMVYIDTTTSPEALQLRLDRITYHKDTIKQLFDVVHSPYYCKYVLDCAEKNDQPEGSFDCDDYSMLAIHMLDEHFNPKLLGVTYKKKNKKFKFGGHMVCYFETLYGFRHMGNQGLSTVYKSLEAMVKDIAYRADGDLIGYTVFDKDLKVIKVNI